MRLRLRERSEVDYQIVRSNDDWWEHQARTFVTAGLIAFLQPDTVLDLACGDGSLVFTAHQLRPISRVTFADISQPSIDFVAMKARRLKLKAEVSVSDVEERLDYALANMQHWDMVLLCEFLEHVPDPVSILRKAKVGQILVASSPLIESPREDDNEEHVWAFDNDGYLELLGESGWKPKIVQNLMLHDGYYNFQIWVAEHG